jgi:hypothetical protein
MCSASLCMCIIEWLHSSTVLVEVLICELVLAA